MFAVMKRLRFACFVVVIQLLVVATTSTGQPVTPPASLERREFVSAVHRDSRS